MTNTYSNGFSLETIDKLRPNTPLQHDRFARKIGEFLTFVQSLAAAERQAVGRSFARYHHYARGFQMAILMRTEVHHLVVDRARRHGSRNSQNFRHLKQKLSKVETEELFWGLLQPFLTPATSDAYDVQALSARLLLCLNPRCPSILETVIHQTLPNYNLSVEELPWYLAKQFGADTLQAALDNASDGIEADIPLQAIETFKYWLSEDWRQRAEDYCQEP